MQLVERLKAEPPSKEMKVELLQEIARENSIKWDDKSLEQRLYTPPQHHHKDEANNDHPEKKTIGNRSRLSFQSRKEESLEDDNSNESIQSRSQDESIQSRSETCAEDLETKPFYYRFMPAPYKIEKQGSLPDKMAISHLMPDDLGEYE